MTRKAEQLFLRGFSFGMKGNVTSITRKCQVTQSAKAHPELVDQYFIEQLEAGKIVCLPHLVPHSWVPFSIAERHGKLRVVFNYSWPEWGVSINSLVPDETAHVRLPRMIDVATLIHSVGTSGYMAKIDLKSAFRQIKLCSADVGCAAYKWRGQTLVEYFMPWGTRAASAACHTMSSAIIEITNMRLPEKSRGKIICYVDDFIVVGETEQECQHILDMLLRVCKDANLVVSVKKTVFPTQHAIALGYDYILNLGLVSIDDDRVEAWSKSLRVIVSDAQISFHDLESLVGKLEFGAPVIYPMKCCIRRFRNAFPKNSDRKFMININEEMREEAKLWLKFLPLLRGLKLSELVLPAVTTVSMCSDASNWGYGAYWEPHWLYGPFHESEVKSGSENNIAWRELFAIACAFAAWGKLLTGCRVLFYCDNSNVFWDVLKKDSKRSEMLELIRQICFQSVQDKFRFHVEWIDRDNNEIADALSKNELIRFRALCDQDSLKYDPVPSLFVRPTGSFWSNAC